MTFDEILDQAIEMLQRRKQLSYRALKRQFDIDDEYLEDLKEELLYSHPVVDDGRGLIWTGEPETQPEPVSPQPTQREATREIQPTQAESLLPEPAPPEAERRQITVMFTDLVDSTKLSGQLDPENYREVLRSYQAACAEVIHRFDGYIAQHLGDALLVYFGFPHAHEDDARRAIHTGLGMLDAMKALNIRLVQEKGIRLSIRVGIHTGLTVIGDIGEGPKRELLALGEAPNVASRVQGVAEPDSIVASEATYRLVQGYFECDDLGFHTLKGVAEPQQVYRVMGEGGAQSRLEVAATRGLTPLVGRESEVTLLLDRWDQVQNEQGQVVLLSGEGGIGKSRLVQVLKDHIADESHLRLECRSSPYYQNTALYPVTDLLERTLQFQADDTPEQQLKKLEQELSQYRLPLEETVPLFAPLLSLSVPEDRYPPLQWSPQRQRQKTLENIVAILLEQAEQQTVLFILEDLHWTDPTTLELIDLLLDQIPTASIYTLLTCRPTFQPSWSSRSYLTPMTVNRLSRNQIESMVVQVAGGKHLPEAVLQQITEKTDGVPLFVEEMTKAVLESGVLKETANQYRLTGSFSSLAIPATLQDSLMARLDRLVTAKAVAQYAAVIGRQFSYELLQTVSQLDEMTLQRELGRLVEAELVYQRGLPPQATYLFKHALVVDAAYQSLLKSTRQQYHQKIAQVLEEQFPETVEAQPELLAHHYTEAVIHEQAIDYWYRAGQKAIERSANVEAIAYLNMGLALLNTLAEAPERIQEKLAFYTSLGAALVATRGYGASEVEDAYNQALELCQQVGETLQGVPFLRGLWMYYLQRDKLQTAQDLGEQCFKLAQRQSAPELLMVAHRMLSTTAYWLGEHAIAREHAERGHTFYNGHQHRTLAFRYGVDPGVSCLAYVTWTLWHLGYPDQALQQNQEMLTLAQELEHSFTLAFALCTAAAHYQFRRDGQTAYESSEAAITLSTTHTFPHWLAMGTVLHGWALMALGQQGEGIAQLRQGMEAYWATGSILGRPWWLALLAEAYSKTGRVDEGLRVVTQGIHVVDETGERYYESELHRLKGELLFMRSSDNQTEAETCYQQALSVARHQQAKSLELRAATSLARLWQSQDKRKEAHDLLAPLYGWFTEGFETADLIDAKALLDELK